MSDLMKLLYNYVQNYRLMGFLDIQGYEETEELKKRCLAKLEKNLSQESLDMLERYQNACDEQSDILREATFQAAYSVARELP